MRNGSFQISRLSRAFAVFLSCWAAIGADAIAESRPNIIFLMSDDQNVDSLGCYGNRDVQTPHLDQLASEGIVFDNHYCTTAICMASRASVMTGMLEYKTGCNFEHGPLAQRKWNNSYPMRLRQSGYITAFAGKFGFEVAESAESKDARLPSEDFDEWGGGPGQTNYATKKNPSMAKYSDEFPHSTLSYGAFGRDFITEASNQDRPFCLSISFKAPHMPATPDPRFNHVYEGMTFQKPSNFGRKYGLHFSVQSQQGRQYERFHSWNYSDRFNKVMAKYHQQIHAIDVAVEMLRDALRDADCDGNTVIIYTSDNGFLCGAHGYGSKVLPYEEASRVPLIIYDPRHPNSGKKLRSSSLTGNIDFAPTILALAGLPATEEMPTEEMPTKEMPTEEMDGADLMTVYEDPQAAIHDSLPLINVWGPIAAQSLAVVTKEMKYIHWFYAGEGMKPTEELYHTGEDPLELTNLIEIPGSDKLLDEMRKRYDDTLSHWKSNAVSINDYQRYSTLFDRDVPWSIKQPMLKKPRPAKSR